MTTARDETKALKARVEAARQAVATTQVTESAKAVRALQRPPKEWALELFETFAVHRLVGIDGAGQCTCGAPAEAPNHKRGKHPDSPNGLDDVAKSRSEIEAWPDSANYGIRTSTELGLVVIDIDPRHAGHETLARLECELGSLPPTPTVITGGEPVDGVEGRHLYFLLSDSDKGRAYNKHFGATGTYPGVDFQGERHYVVGPGSKHESGRFYRWAPGASPGELDFATLPEKWATFALKPVQTTGTFSGSGLEDNASQDELDAAEENLANFRKKNPTAAGRGNDDLYRACAILRTDWGLSAEQALPLLVRHNAQTHNKRGEAELLGMLERSDVGQGERGQKRAEFRRLRDVRQLGAAIVSMLEARTSANDNTDPSPVVASAVANQSRVASGGIPAAFRPDGPNLITQIGVSPVEAEVTDQTIAHLVRVDAEVFDFVGALVTLSRGERDDSRSLIPFGTPRVVCLTREAIQDRASRYARFYATKEDGGRRQVRIPSYVAGAILARSSWPGIKPLTGLIEAPSLRPDGSLITESGYDEQTGLYLVPNIEVAVPDSPTLSESQEALRLIAELFCDMPFEAEAHRFAAVSYILTLVGRSAIAGCTPLFLFDSSTPGSGKSLLTDVASFIATGRPMTRRGYSPNPEEQRKTITAILQAGARSILFDNIANGSAFGSSHLDAVTTGTVWSDRVLGKSESTADLPINTVFAASGNNLSLLGDLYRRVVHVRLAPNTERPEDRTDFKHTDLIGHVRRNRRELLGAALTLLRGYITAGQPYALQGWGSFNEWSKLVRGSIVWAGGIDPHETRKSLTQTADTGTSDLLELLRAMQVIDPQSRGLSAARLLKGAPTQAPLEALCGLPDGRPLTPKLVGKTLARWRQRIVDGRRLASRPVGGTLQWFTEVVT